MKFLGILFMCFGLYEGVIKIDNLKTHRLHSEEEYYVGQLEMNISGQGKLDISKGLLELRGTAVELESGEPLDEVRFVSENKELASLSSNGEFSFSVPFSISDTLYVLSPSMKTQVYFFQE
ncbi:MAG: hypothetical protein SchgKO_06620 [Schleiferiaceae bacterium]